MEELETNAGDSEIISFNETITIWTEVETMENISEPNPILPAYIAYTSFVLFRYLQFVSQSRCVDIFQFSAHPSQLSFN